jgi:hypothetical protein
VIVGENVSCAVGAGSASEGKSSLFSDDVVTGCSVLWQAVVASESTIEGELFLSAFLLVTSVASCWSDRLVGWRGVS